MKKIVIITNHSYMLWRFHKELIMKLQEDNEIVIAFPFVGHEKDFKDLGIRCIETKLDRRSLNPVNDLKLKRSYERILRKERPDMVITYSIKCNIYAGLVCRKLKIPYYANVQGLGTPFQKPVLSQLVTEMYRKAMKDVEIVFFENEANAAMFRKKKIIPAARQIVLQGAGINTDYYKKQPYPQNERTHFLYVGRLMKEKGIDELFEAAKRLRREEDFILDIVGFFEESYKEEVREMEIARIVNFYGFQQDPRPYYKKADCVILPSYHEGMSNVLLEGASMGRPLITTDIPGCREAVIDKESGYLVQPKDSESAYQAMKRFIKLPTDQREQMGLRGRELMEQRFNKHNVVENTIKGLDL